MFFLFSVGVCLGGYGRGGRYSFSTALLSFLFGILGRVKKISCLSSPTAPIFLPDRDFFFYFFILRKTGIREGRHTIPRPFHRNVEESRRERKSTSFTEHCFQSAVAHCMHMGRRALEKWKEWELDEYWSHRLMLVQAPLYLPSP